MSRIVVLSFASLLLFTSLAQAQRGSSLLRGWKTDTSQKSIELDELLNGGPPKDGIPSINQPAFVSAAIADEWLQDQEPVILVALENEARAYPLQILTFHEIVNDVLAGRPIIVTFCPLCYAALAFDRRIDGVVHSFGVSGMLRHSDMVMFDRETESLWQQLNGEGIVGTYTGKKLTPIPAQIISYRQFKEAHPFGEVLSRETGHRRNYGQNPYAGYDDINDRPFLYKGPFDKRVPPMEKLVTVSIGDEDKAYPHSITRKERVIHDEVGGASIVIFHGEGAVSALDKKSIAESKIIGTTGVFYNDLEDQSLRFRYDNGFFFDESGTKWDVTGKAIAGPKSGKQLRPIPHGNFFAFAWFAFKPGTPLYN